MLDSRAGEPANFLPAPAPDFFFQAAPAPRSQKHPAPTGSGSGSPALLDSWHEIEDYMYMPGPSGLSFHNALKTITNAPILFI